MTKKIKILLTEDQYEFLNSKLDSHSYYIGDNGLTDTKEGKAFFKLCDKFTKSFNKSTGHYYLWQLKDRDQPVTQENIKDEWK